VNTEAINDPEPASAPPWADTLAAADEALRPPEPVQYSGDPAADLSLAISELNLMSDHNSMPVTERLAAEFAEGIERETSNIHSLEATINAEREGYLERMTQLHLELARHKLAREALSSAASVLEKEPDAAPVELPKFLPAATSLIATPPAEPEPIPEGVKYDPVEDCFYKRPGRGAYHPGSAFHIQWRDRRNEFPQVEYLPPSNNEQQQGNDA